jgi:hypothetical protein
VTAQTNTTAAGGAQLVGTPGRPARDDERRPECRHWIGVEKRHCREGEGVRQYIGGLRCPAHTPSALLGKPEPQPGPGWPIHRQETP